MCIPGCTVPVQYCTQIYVFDAILLTWIDEMKLENGDSSARG
jgi:hypothetical protein